MNEKDADVVERTETTGPRLGWLRCGGRVAPITVALAAPRCGARCRDGHPCQGPAVRGKKRCRMHGGTARGPRSESGYQASISSRRKDSPITRPAAEVRDLAELRDLRTRLAEAEFDVVDALAKYQAGRWTTQAVTIARDVADSLAGQVYELEALARDRRRARRRRRRFDAEHPPADLAPVDPVDPDPEDPERA